MLGSYMQENIHSKKSFFLFFVKFVDFVFFYSTGDFANLKTKTSEEKGKGEQSIV